jgi:hypothetical protein
MFVELRLANSGGTSFANDWLRVGQKVKSKTISFGSMETGFWQNLPGEG